MPASSFANFGQDFLLCGKSFITTYIDCAGELPIAFAIHEDSFSMAESLVDMILEKEVEILERCCVQCRVRVLDLYNGVAERGGRRTQQGRLCQVPFCFLV